MTLIKCKMCGGELKILPNSTICECEYCGSKQTIPNTDDEKRLKLYERANKLRFENEFDKAAGVYESIVAEYQSEAEAYWGLVLCKYGIEYVDDPKTGKKIPTCHRSSFDSVMDDSNFDLVMENSDTVARSIYREEAKQIEELRKGIVEVSSKEEPYDIFICYKETADDGQRTIDSVIAQDVYQELSDKGYRVFFSRITLEDKLGQEYEPYIFAALNSAKVMLAFGTCYDYYNAVWVKNEWSRFLQLMEAGQKKTLIPCFKDIDAYDMPKEFARLQAQDMGKVGATQDLLRGIDKIFGRDKKQVETTAVLKASGDSNATVKRGYFALEDGEWEKAIQYFDLAMDSDPENAEIHLGLFLAKRSFTDLDSYLEAQIKNLSSVSKDSLLACKPKEDEIEKIAEENAVPGYLKKKDITDQFMYKLTYSSSVDGLNKEKEVYEDKDWKKAERLAKDELLSQITAVKKKHLDAIEQLVESESQKDKATAEKISNEYDQFIEDTRKKVIDSRFQAEAQREKDYVDVTERLPKADNEQECRSIISELDKIGVYKDSQSLLDECNKKLTNIKNEQQRILDAQKVKTKKTIKLISIVVAVASVLIVAGVFGYKTYQNKVVIPNQKYDEACALMTEQKYEDAIAIFTELDGYKDSTSKIDECNQAITDAVAAEEAAEKAAAEEKLQKELNEKYQSIIEKIDEDDYEGAIEELTSVGDEETRTQIKNYLVNDVKNDLSELRNSDDILFYGVDKRCLEVIDIVDDSPKEELTKLHDKKCLLIGLSKDPLKLIRSHFNGSKDEYVVEDYVSDYFDKLIEYTNYEEDIDRLNKYSGVISRASKHLKISYYEENKGVIIEGSESISSIKYDMNNHCLYTEIPGKEKLYVITGGSESVILGETTDKGIYRFKSNGEIEILSEPVEQEAETFFEDDLD